jgi:hypothetical protein
LYDEHSGYFTTRDVIISSRDRPHGKCIPFTFLKGEYEYKLEMHELYQQQPGKWLTPVEIFAPHYSRALVNYMLATRKSQRLRIVEIGGGRGSNMLHMLDHLRDTRPDIYAEAKVTMIEISPHLHQAQRAALQTHSPVCSFVRCGAEDIGSNHSLHCKEEVFLIMMEVLDNMPHDKIQSIHGQTHETVVVERNGTFYEETREITDPSVKFIVETGLIDLKASGHLRTIASILPRLFQPPTAWFVPTGALKMLRSVVQAFPNHRLIVADFDYLPPPQRSSHSFLADGSLDAVNSPLVSGSIPGTNETVDHFTYLTNPGSSDIFFPVDFATLKEMYRLVCNRKAQVMKSSAFLHSHADLQQTRTRSGYNPLLEDFTNTSFLLS